MFLWKKIQLDECLPSSDISSWFSRSKVPSSTATHDCTGYPAIPQHFENLELNTPRATCVYIHFSVADGCRYHTFSKYSILLDLTYRSKYVVDTSFTNHTGPIF